MANYIQTVQTFEINKLFDLVKIKTLYYASGIVSNGATQEKSYAITDNEKDFFDITLKDAAARVYDQVSQDAKIVETPFQYNVDGKIIYSLMVHKNWDKNQSFSLNTAIEISLCDYVMKEWLRLRGVPSQAMEASYQEQIALVKNLLNRRIVPAQKIYRYV